jgi:hypothetical protein
MQRFEKLVGTEKTRRMTIFNEIRERIKALLGAPETISVEDRYELESCRTLTYDDVVTWLFANKPSDFDGALLYRFKNERNKVFPVVVTIVYVSNDNPLFGRGYLKKLIHCTYMDEELENLFNGRDFIIVK